MSKQKNKLILAMCAMCVAFLGVVGALVGVLAASTQSVGSSFSVTYSVGQNVTIAVGAMSNTNAGGSMTGSEWFVAESSGGSSSNQSSENGDLYIMTESEASKGFMLKSDDVSMSATETCTIIFCFQNLSGQAIECAVTDNCHILNMSVLHLFHTSNISESFTRAKLEDYCGNAWNYAEPTDLDENNSYSFVINANEIGFVIVDLGVMDENKSAYYTSTAENGLSFSFQ